MRKEVVIIVATHKKYRMPEDNMYMPVYVGAAGKDDIGYQRDDDGENISELNPFFCELTGLYWAWKNIDADYIGLVHYRRYFGSGVYDNDKWNTILKKGDIEKYLNNIKVFVPRKRRYWIESLYSHYAHTHHRIQLDEAGRIIEQYYPEYIRSFEKVCRRRWGYMFNMIIMEKNMYSSYCDWLFDILFELKRRLGEDGLSPFHSRYYGRISEIIFNVWIDEQIKSGIINRANIKELPIIHMENIKWKKKGMAFLKARFFGEKYSESF